MDGIQLGESIFKEVMSRLDSIMVKLGEGAAKIFEIYLRQQVAYGVADFIGALAFLIAMGVCIKFGLARYRAEKEIEEKQHYVPSDDKGWYWIWAASAATLFIPVVVLIINGVLRVMNPEYYAIRQILQEFSRAVN